VTDAKELFKPGKRYRGFAPVGARYVPVGLNIFPVNPKEVRIRHLFPSKVAEKIREGDILYVLVEDEEKLVAEIRIVKKEERGILANLDFVTEDKRKLPRVKVEDLLEVQGTVTCRGVEFSGRVIDLSLTSVSIRTGSEPPLEECELTLKYRSKMVRLKGRVVRKEDGVTVLEIVNGNNAMVEFLQKIYSDLFLKAQRLS